jgi:hypothetical protein
VPAVISCRRRYHCPSRGCLVNRSRDCTRSRVPPLRVGAILTLLRVPLFAFIIVWHSACATRTDPLKAKGRCPSRAPGWSTGSCRRRPERSPRSSALSWIFQFPKLPTRLCRPALRAALRGRGIPLRTGRPGTCYPGSRRRAGLQRSAALQPQTMGNASKPNGCSHVARAQRSRLADRAAPIWHDFFLPSASGTRRARH